METTAAALGSSDLSTSGQVLFMACALVALTTAVGTVAQRSPLRAAMALLAHIISLAGLYLSLHAHLLAAIQMLVYAGAVVVLFVFVIMLIGPGAMASRADDRGVTTKIIGAATVAMLAGAIAFQVGAATAPRLPIESCAPEATGCVEFGSVEALSQAIFVTSAVPFELVSLLLLVAIIVAVAVARGVHPGEGGEREGEPAPLPIRPTVLDPLPGRARSESSPAE